MSSNFNVVEMNDISKSFFGVKVLDNVSFAVTSGEIHALAGENGAGKSTLMKILQGVYTLDSGEIQIAGDRYGTVCHLSERDCSIQRRHQKLVEESPSPFMTPELRKAMGDAACKAASAIGYESVGTIEFLVDKHRNFYFMEMNTRIQVEHCVTEEVTNFDLIKEQILIAQGEKISGENYEPQMHAIECRINAEDPYNDFRPSPGKITTLHQPGGHGIRIDSHVYAGYVIPPYYDSMIAKIIAVARTREEAINTMSRALSEYVIEGVKTTIPFHQQLMNDENFRKGNFTTKFLEGFTMK